MSFIVDRLFPAKPIEPLPAGSYTYTEMLSEAQSLRLHLRLQPEGAGLLIVNASTVLHLNETAAAHAYRFVQGDPEKDAARFIQRRYRVGWGKALRDQQALRAQLRAIVSTPDLDPVLFLGMDRAEPCTEPSGAPYRLDLALTYALDPDGQLDPAASRRASRELTTEEWRGVLHSAWQAGIPHVTFTGGEPCRRADLPDLIQHAEALGLVTGVLTSGARLADPQYMQALANAGLDHVVVSWDPGDAASTLGLRNASSSDVFTTAHLTLGPGAEPKLPRWLSALQEMQVNAVSLTGIAGEDSRGILEAAQDQVASLGLRLVWDLPVPYSRTNPIALEVGQPSGSTGCAALYVEPDGDVLRSQASQQVLGSSLSDSWESLWERARSTASGAPPG